MLSIHLRLGLPSDPFPSGFPTNNLYTFLTGGRIREGNIKNDWECNCPCLDGPESQDLLTRCSHFCVCEACTHPVAVPSSKPCWLLIVPLRRVTGERRSVVNTGRHKRQVLLTIWEASAEVRQLCSPLCSGFVPVLRFRLRFLTGPCSGWAAATKCHKNSLTTATVASCYDLLLATQEFCHRKLAY
jgi:hypothetical protein